MKMPVPASGEGFERCPAGNHLAVCYEVIDLGTQEANFNKEVKHQRKVWIGFYQELFQAAMRLHNKSFSGALRPELVTAKIAEADKARLEMLSSVWLPLYQGGALSLKSLLERVPGVDPAAEEKAIGEAAAKRAKDMADQFGGGAHDHGDDTDEE